MMQYLPRIPRTPKSLENCCFCRNCASNIVWDVLRGPFNALNQHLPKWLSRIESKLLSSPNICKHKHGFSTHPVFLRDHFEKVCTSSFSVWRTRCMQKNKNSSGKMTDVIQRLKNRDAYGFLICQLRFFSRESDDVVSWIIFLTCRQSGSTRLPKFWHARFHTSVCRRNKSASLRFRAFIASAQNFRSFTLILFAIAVM